MSTEKNNMKKIAIILGTRPEIIKMSPIIRACHKQKLDYFIIHTNQHYTSNMDLTFFQELELPQPKYNIGVNSETYHGRMTGKMLIGIEDVLLKEKPDWVLVEGDTNTVVAGALIASKMGIHVGHVEAGLRSYDMNMPEEINRIITDHISTALFCPTDTQKNILQGEGIDKKKIHVTGNTIVDALEQNLELALKSDKYAHYKTEKYLLLTLHRPSNVDNVDVLKIIINTIEEVSKEFGLMIYFPMHPRTKAQLEKFGIVIRNKKIIVMEPVGYLEMLQMEKHAQLILTDSGGLQEEACILKVPCVTLRESTERPETLKIDANIIVGHDPEKIISGIQKMLKSKRKWDNPFGDGTSSNKILRIIKRTEI